MMMYLCIIYFFFMCMLVYSVNHSYITPAFLYNFMMLISSVILSVNYKQWGNEAPIYPQTVLALIIASASFSLSCFIINFLLLYKKSNNDEEKAFLSNKKINEIYYAYPQSFINVLAAVFLILYVAMTIREVGGFKGQFVSLLSSIYNFNVNEDTSNFALHQVQVSLMGMAYISFYEWLCKKYILKESASDSILIPAFCHLIAALFSTDRNILLRFVIFCLVLWILFFKNREYGNSVYLNKQIFKKGVILVLIIAAVFYVFGKAKGYKSNFWQSISEYCSAGIFDLNYYIHNTFGHVPLEHGKNIFFKLNETLSFLSGNSYGDGVLKTDDFIYILMNNGFYYRSNIYTALFPILKDFGYFGVAIVPFIMGIYFEGLYVLTRVYSFGYAWLFYASMIYPVIYMPILDQFFARMHLGIIYEIFWLWFWYFFAYHVKSGNKYKISFPKIKIVFRSH